MRSTTALAAALLCLVLAAGACGSDEDGAADTTPAPDGLGVEVPDRPPDLVGTITVITPFEPITEDCTPPEDLDPDGAVSSDDPPVCTSEDDDVIGTILVEGDLAPERGRKISYTVTGDTEITGAVDGVGVGTFDDFAEGQLAETWAAGPCAESYPEQCALEAIRVTG
jgi:hypothetical protein